MSLKNIQMLNLVNSIIENNNILIEARKKAGIHVNNDSKNMKNCCASTLSYLLLNVPSLSLRPTARAMKLAYMLETEIGFSRVGINETINVGDIGIVDQPKVTMLQDLNVDSVQDGDAEDSDSNVTLESSFLYKGDGYVELDKSNKNWHHIYLVIDAQPQSKNLEIVLIADNQAETPHLRNVQGGDRSKTNFFLRANV